VEPSYFKVGKGVSCIEWGRDQPWKIERSALSVYHYKKLNYIPTSLREEAIKAAKLIPDDCFVAMSGGVDSETIAQLFLDIGKPFTALSLDFGINSEDLRYARKWCKDNKVRHIVIGKEYLQLATSIFLNYRPMGMTIHGATRCWLAHRFQPIVFGDGDMEFLKDGTLMENDYAFGPLVLANHTDSQNYNFWAMTSELQYMFIDGPEANNKYVRYQEIHPTVEHRKSLHGLEELEGSTLWSLWGQSNPITPRHMIYESAEKFQEELIKGDIIVKSDFEDRMTGQVQTF